MSETPLLPPLPEDWDRALCVAAHPDDLEYGAAAVVARWTSRGKTVTYLLATRGEAGIDGMHPEQAGPLREREERAGAAVVGVDVVEFLDFTDGVVEYGLDLRRAIAAAIRRHRPEVVLTGPFGVTFAGGITNQADHRAVGLATLDAARDAGNRWIFPELGEEGLEPWGGVRMVVVPATQPAVYAIDVTGHVDVAIDSLAAHEAYMEGLGDSGFDPAAFLRWQYAAGGEAMGTEAAVPVGVYVLIPDEGMPWEE